MDNLLYTCLIVSIATFGITYIVRYTKGPFDTFIIIRRKVSLEMPVYDETGQIVEWIENPEPDAFFGKLISCFWCLSTWVAFVLTVTYILLDVYVIKFSLFIWFFSVGLSGFLHDLLQD